MTVATESTTESRPTFGDVMEQSGWVLALESSGLTGSVALARGGSVVAQAVIEEPRAQAARLVPALTRLMAQHAVVPTEVAGVVCGEGPGSFTGLRVAAASAKGWLFGTNVAFWPVSSLAGAAVDDEAWEHEVRRTVVFDARGDRIYAARYRRRASSADAASAAVGALGSLEVETEPFAGTLTDLRNDGPEHWGVLAGSACDPHGEQLQTWGFTLASAPAGWPRAAGLLQRLLLDPTRKAHDNPRSWQPRYLRPSSAKPLPRPPGP